MQSVLRWLWLVTLTALLVACSTPNPASVSHKSTSGYKSARTTVPVTKGGGYYKDDGPGDRRLPDNPDAIPDAVPVNEPLLTSANRPYTVMGQTYIPESNQSAYRARGKASWYGKKFHGKRTASGEAYDMYEMTAAHPTLPIPSYARITNTSNGRSVVVRINDRGPFHSSRLIDLSALP
jgi:rare lipoprotein A